MKGQHRLIPARRDTANHELHSGVLDGATQLHGPKSRTPAATTVCAVRFPKLAAPVNL